MSLVALLVILLIMGGAKLISVTKEALKPPPPPIEDMQKHIKYINSLPSLDAVWYYIHNRKPGDP